MPDPSFEAYMDREARRTLGSSQQYGKTYQAKGVDRDYLFSRSICREMRLGLPGILRQECAWSDEFNCFLLRCDFAKASTMSHISRQSMDNTEGDKEGFNLLCESLIRQVKEQKGKEERKFNEASIYEDDFKIFDDKLLNPYPFPSVMQPKPKPSPMKNYKNIIALAQDGVMRTLRAATVGTPVSKLYRVRKELAEELKEKDFIAVPFYNGSVPFTVLQVVEIHEDNRVGPDDGEVPLVVCKIDSAAYEEQQTKENEMAERLKKADEEESKKKAKIDVLNALTPAERLVLGVTAQDEPKRL